jgi:hypothetical protein
MAGQAADVDLQKSTHLLPGSHDVERIVSRQVVVALGMSDDNLPAGVEDLTNHVVVVSLQLEAELNQKVSVRQAYIRSPYHSADGTGIGRPNLLAQRQGREIVSPLSGLLQAVERITMEIELPIQCRPIELRKEKMGSRNDGADSLAVQGRQRGQGVRNAGSSIVHPWNQVAVEIRYGKGVRALI